MTTVTLTSSLDKPKTIFGRVKGGSVIHAWSLRVSGEYKAVCNELWSLEEKHKMNVYFDSKICMQCRRYSRELRSVRRSRWVQTPKELSPHNKKK